MAQHAETSANDIDLDLLRELSDDDLKELGLSLGHRRRLLRASRSGRARHLRRCLCTWQVLPPRTTSRFVKPSGVS